VSDFEQKATALVDKWAKEYRAYLKDGGGSANAVHPAARAALIDHVTLALSAAATATAEVITLHSEKPRVRVVADTGPEPEDDTITSAGTSAGKVKPVRRKKKAEVE
jgi:hypothetical protein